MTSLFLCQAFAISYLKRADQLDLDFDYQSAAMDCDEKCNQNKINQVLAENDDDDDITILSSDEEVTASKQISTEVIDILSDDDEDGDYGYSAKECFSNQLFKKPTKEDDDCEFLDEIEENGEGHTNYEDMNNCGAHSDDTFNIKDEHQRVLVNVDHGEDEEPIYLPQHLADAVKPHQIGGIRFLYDNIIINASKFNRTTGLGCILAHSMGLGKTFQLITFIDIFLTQTSAKHVLCIVPINTLQNWMNEFDMWLPNKGILNFTNPESKVKHRDFAVYMLNDCKTITSRAKEIRELKKS